MVGCLPQGSPSRRRHPKWGGGGPYKHTVWIRSLGGPAGLSGSICKLRGREQSKINRRGLLLRRAPSPGQPGPLNHLAGSGKVRGTPSSQRLQGVHRKGISRGSKEHLESLLHLLGADLSQIELILQSRAKGGK